VRSSAARKQEYPIFFGALSISILSYMIPGPVITLVVRPVSVQGSIFPMMVNPILPSRADFDADTTRRDTFSVQLCTVLGTCLFVCQSCWILTLIKGMRGAEFNTVQAPRAELFCPYRIWSYICLSENRAEADPGTVLRGKEHIVHPKGTQASKIGSMPVREECNRIF